ncbi:FAD-binding domain-containing protein [Eremomyces bilateralis CBS 781.70]|uniref:FAD-binding domain-containing protein n=1 Tax=Eremomyces bilateralis CBS 781.70 TaxID=1392243 RepID=A0A6G1G6C0_9PEZI|nr:FAD-binding domain-containing protein [Eremomyces bilateralis CBS 781.70]KAF1813617.1 FAD-binding domain-containing protein [Eremomyces bilateralis CBS 781.70]
MRPSISTLLIGLAATECSAQLTSFPNPSTGRGVTAACAALERAIPGKVVFAKDNSTSYHEVQDDYWHAGLSEWAPPCIVLPTAAEEVAAAVKVLNQHPTVKFAVKSGGHDANPGHSSIKDGVLIALEQLTGTELDKENGVAHIKPGGNWSGVIKALDAEGYAVLSGRLGIVGIGGFITGGGMSFLSAQHGLTADTAVNFETVRADGSIQNINATSDPEVFRAMKGSTNQFGIVTKFTLKAYPIGQVWGGSRIYLPDVQREVLKATHDFISNPSDPKAAIIVNHNMVMGGVTIVQVFFFYDGTTPPSAAFNGLLEIPSVQDQTAVRSYAELLDFNSEGAAGFKHRSSWRSITLPLLPGDGGIDFMQNLVNNWQNISLPYFSQHAEAVQTIAIQPLPSLFGKHSQAAGGNAMGLTGSDGPRYIIELSSIWGSPQNGTDDQTIYGLATQVTKYAERSLATALRQPVNRGAERYNPFFLNDANFNQDVLKSYKDYNSFRWLQRRNDPAGLFLRRVGGFKY